MRTFDFVRTALAGRRGTEVRPRFLTYTVTYKCNARCIMCDSWKIRSADDLRIPELERIFRQLPRLDVLRLTGGEPFVRRDFPEIVDLATRELDPMVVHVTTNGFLTEEIVRFCEERSRRAPLQLLVSVDGVGSEHDRIRGREGAWKATLETLRVLARRRRKLGLTLAVNQTIVDEAGIEQYRHLRDTLAPLDIRNQVVLAYDVSATYSTERDIDVAPQRGGAFSAFGSFDRRALCGLLDELDRDQGGYPWKERLAKRYYLDGLRSRIERGQGSPNPSCSALHEHLRIFPNGDVPTCQFNSKVVGNLRESNFEDVWASASAGEQRRWVRACAGCWAECEVLPSAIYTGDLARHALRKVWGNGFAGRRNDNSETCHGHEHTDERAAETGLRL